MDLEYLIPEVQEIIRGNISRFNKAALKFSQIPKHWQNEYSDEKNYIKYRKALSEYRSIKEILSCDLLKFQLLLNPVKLSFMPIIKLMLCNF
jgi:hypothetical protein